MLRMSGKTTGTFTPRHQDKNSMVDMSQNSALKEQLAEATKLESKLSRKNESSKDTQVYQRRLCELLSQVLISDPEIAMKTDCSARLWRGCFYANISKLRGTITKTKKRGKGSAEVKLLEDQLRSYIAEAISLYVYLVDNYEKKLTSSVSGSGVVPNLYRLLIYQGDLHRYKAEYNKSESFYLKASRLAPGRGNPYNQLAVVSQQSHVKSSGFPKTCVALYWYIRSLLATYEPFETSRSNMTRLFESNSSWLEKNILPRPPDSSGKNKKEFTDQQRQYKSVISRHFLCEFVKLHGMLFSLKSPPEPQRIVEQACALREQFKTLVGDQALGEALVLKMVAITVHSCTLPKQKSIALACALDFGAVLANAVSGNLRDAYGNTKKLSDFRTSSKKGENIVNIKMFPPLVLLCKWISSLDRSTFSSTDAVNATDSFMEQAASSFWEEVAIAATHLQILYDSLASDRVRKYDGDLREYDIMRGFSPFTMFVDHEPRSSYFSGDNDVNYRGFLPLKEAAESSRRNANFSTHASTEEETHTRLEVFFGFISNFSLSNDNTEHIFVRYDKTKKQYLRYDKCTQVSSPYIEAEIYSNIEKVMDMDCDSLESTKICDKPVEKDNLPEELVPAKSDEDNEDVIVYSGTLGKKEDNVEEIDVEGPIEHDNRICNLSVIKSVIPQAVVSPGPYVVTDAPQLSRSNRENVVNVERATKLKFVNHPESLGVGKCANEYQANSKVHTDVDKIGTAGVSFGSITPQALPAGKVIQPPPGFGNIDLESKLSNPTSGTNAYDTTSSRRELTTSMSSMHQFAAPGVFSYGSRDSNVGLENKESLIPTGSAELSKSTSSRTPAPPPGFSHTIVPQARQCLTEKGHVDSMPFESLRNASSAFPASNNLNYSKVDSSDGLELQTANPFVVSNMARSHQDVGGFDLPGFKNNESGFLQLSPFFRSMQSDPTKNTPGKQVSSHFIPSEETWNPFL